MADRSPWVTDDNAPLLTDLYELTMTQAYVARGMTRPATFDLFVRSLPRERNFLLAAGLEDCLRYLERLRFDEASIDALRRTGEFSEGLLEYLRGFRFTGDVWAAPEGTPMFGEAPLASVTAPLPEAQLAESFLLNQMTFATLIASKAARAVLASGERTVVDFSLRRVHGADASMKGARAMWIAGVEATSNVLAGGVYGIPISGTMAHSFIQAHEDEARAFEDFANEFPETTLLVDTYDTIEGVRKVIDLARRMGERFRVRAIRLDSGDLGELAKESRGLLDAAGLERVRIFASGGLDEKKIAALVTDGAPIDGFGVGTDMGVSTDAPALDSAYKLAACDGAPKMKLSSGKATLPGKKQVWRVGAGDGMHDVIGLREESIDGRPLLVQVMAGGERTAAGRETLEVMRERAKREIAALPARLRRLEPADPPYRVEVSDRLRSLRDETAARLRSE
jgi:nicotinate phosphoribosyltransferase